MIGHSPVKLIATRWDYSVLNYYKRTAWKEWNGLSWCCKLREECVDRMPPLSFSGSSPCLPIMSHFILKLEIRLQIATQIIRRFQKPQSKKKKKNDAKWVLYWFLLKGYFVICWVLVKETIKHQVPIINASWPGEWLPPTASRMKYMVEFTQTQMTVRYNFVWMHKNTWPTPLESGH